MRFGDGQLYGAVAVLAILNIFALFWITHKPAPVSACAPFADDGAGKRFVEIAGDSRGNGIYFVPKGTNVRDILEKAEAAVPDTGQDKAFLKELENGTKVVVETKSRRIKLERVSNSKRYALHKPMDLNTINERELMLVPGIGEKTARAIIESRKTLGGFEAVEDLLTVPGIGEKKVEKFKQSFFVGNKS